MAGMVGWGVPADVRRGRESVCGMVWSEGWKRGWCGGGEVSLGRSEARLWARGAHSEYTNLMHLLHTGCACSRVAEARRTWSCSQWRVTSR